MKIDAIQLVAGLIVGVIIGAALLSFSGTFDSTGDETNITITSTTSITTSITSTSTSISSTIITSIGTTIINQTSTLTETTTSTISTTMTTTATITATVTNTRLIIGSQDFIILSSSFGDNEDMPQKFVCTNQGGQNISPGLVWSSPPEGTESLVLIMDDPDAPGSFTHWVLFNLPPDITELPEAVPSVNVLENGGIHGNNGLGQRGYFGPCPPSGIHGYKFRIYAIDIVLDLDPGASKQTVLTAISGHILDEALLTGNWGN